VLYVCVMYGIVCVCNVRCCMCVYCMVLYVCVVYGVVCVM